MFGTEYTYKYIAQAPGAYGVDTYGEQTYSCDANDTVCQTQAASGPGAPNTGFFSPANAPTFAWSFVAVAVVVAVVSYVLIRKFKKAKANS
ncbi:MAG: hypothetical protein WAQ27_04530 [Candidatus Microsaccharimonas sp.]